MKKLFLALIAIGSVALGASARSNYAHDGKVLPAVAQAIVADNFNAKVSVVKIDKDFGRISEYDVTLSDGTEITFDRDGNWKDIETNYAVSVPDNLLPKSISSYVKSNFPDSNVVGIEKTRGGYEVELSNGVDMNFDKGGQFKRYE